MRACGAMGNAIKRATCFQLAVMKREITEEYDFPGYEIAFCVYFFFFGLVGLFRLRFVTLRSA